MAPALFDEVQFTMELREKKNWKSSRLASNLEKGWDGHEIGLVVKDSSATTVCGPGLAREILATLRLLGFHPLKSSLLQDDCHALEQSSMLMSIGEVEWLLASIRKAPVGHWHLDFDHLSILSMH
jgi:hypothetical protein